MPVPRWRRVPWWMCVVAALYARVLLQCAARSERRRIGALSLAVVLFGIIMVHNFFTRNWTMRFGGAPLALFSEASSVGEVVLFPLVPLTLAYCVLAEKRGQTGQGAVT